MLLLENKGAIVTGASTLIGAAVARALVGQGAKVVLADVDADKGEKLAGELGGKAVFVKTDVCADEQIDGAVASAMKFCGRIDVLVNIAAAYVDNGPASPREDWLKSFDINLFGAVMFLRAVRPHMAAVGGGAVVNFGSTSAHVAQAGRWTYPATKAAMLQFTRSAALDLAADGIRVNAVSPGWTWSGILDLISGGDLEKTNRVAAPFHMLKRVATPEEVANAVTFLCTPQSSFITGANLPVDGGYSAMGPEQMLSPIAQLMG
ncbi:MAG: SDR family oxidoreductase [Rhodocyclaceae bacterium]|nr:MAG: SDR family oxidoreductase [Rhodocyclaceae bacterium]